MTSQEFNQVLSKILNQVPEDILEGLNLGVRVDDSVKYHEESINNDLYVLGQYQRGPMGRGIVLFYGSFMKVYGSTSQEKMEEEIRRILYHELTHHLENRAKKYDLEVEDARFIYDYKRRKGYFDQGGEKE